MGHFFKTVILHPWYLPKSPLLGFRRRVVIPKIRVNKQELHLKLESKQRRNATPQCHSRPLDRTIWRRRNLGRHHSLNSKRVIAYLRRSCGKSAPGSPASSESP